MCVCVVCMCKLIKTCVSECQTDDGVYGLCM